MPTTTCCEAARPTRRPPISCAKRIRETVNDPKVAELLCPDNVIGCKRPCLDTGYFETYNRSNVELVDARERAIERITGRLAWSPGGREFELDCLVFATGFDAMTGAVLGIDIRGRGGEHAERNSGTPDRAPTSASARSASRTCSSSPGRVVRRC